MHEIKQYHNANTCHSCKLLLCSKCTVSNAQYGIQLQNRRSLISCVALFTVTYWPRQYILLRLCIRSRIPSHPQPEKFEKRILRYTNIQSLLFLFAMTFYSLYFSISIQNMISSALFWYLNTLYPY